MSQGGNHRSKMLHYTNLRLTKSLNYFSVISLTHPIPPPRVNAKDLLLQFPECLHIIYFIIQTTFIISWCSPIQELSRSNLACLSELSQNWMTIVVALGKLVSTIMHFQIVFPRHPLF